MDAGDADPAVVRTAEAAGCMDRGLPGGHGVYIIKGAAAGVVSTLAFAAVHAVFISDIWYSVAPMSVAGTICGASIAGSFLVLRDRRSLRGWLLYDATLVSLFVLLGGASMVLCEPVTTIPALFTADGPPTDLFGVVMPLLAVFTLAARPSSRSCSDGGGPTPPRCS